MGNESDGGMRLHVLEENASEEKIIKYLLGEQGPMKIEKTERTIIRTIKFENRATKRISRMFK